MLRFNRLRLKRAARRCLRRDGGGQIQACRCFELASVVRVKAPMPGFASLGRMTLRTIVARCMSRPRKLRTGKPSARRRLCAFSSAAANAWPAPRDRARGPRPPELRFLNRSGQQRFRIGRIALEDRNCHRAAAGIRQQAVVHLQSAGLAVAAIADLGQRAGRAFEAR